MIFTRSTEPTRMHPRPTAFPPPCRYCGSAWYLDDEGYPFMTPHDQTKHPGPPGSDKSLAD